MPNEAGKFLCQKNSSFNVYYFKIEIILKLYKNKSKNQY